MEDNDRFGMDSDETPRRGYEGIILELARKGVQTSLKRLMSTEEGLRMVISALVPKEIGQYVTRELELFRTGILEIIKDEMSKFLGRINLAEEIQNTVDGLNFDVKLQLAISKRPTDQPPEADPPPQAKVKKAPKTTPKGKPKTAAKGRAATTKKAP